MHTTCVVIGAGHAGLAMSRRLTERSIDHIVLERGEVANSWATQRWDSLRLLTPSWLNRLPGIADVGEDPDGYMTMPEITGLLRDYAVDVSAPIRPRTTVTRVSATADGYQTMTDQGAWTSESVVLASGPANLAAVPSLAMLIPPTVETVTPLTYRSPDGLAPGGVLVVGASATGVQLADEIQRSGRPVTLAVGEHVRVPRRYRGRDIFWWLDASGILDQRHTDVDDLVRARHVPSPQLIGSSERAAIDLNTLSAQGIRLVGRLSGVTASGVVQFSGGLSNLCALADLKLNRLLDTLDGWAMTSGADVPASPHRFEPTHLAAPSPLELDLGDAGISTIIWATGYRSDYSWLDIPVFDRSGRIRHDGGVVHDAPGMYVLGGNLLRRRRSSYIGGAPADTADLSAHLHRQLDATRHSSDSLPSRRTARAPGPIPSGSSPPAKASIARSYSSPGA